MTAPEVEVGAALAAAVPFVRTLGVRVLAAGADEAGEFRAVAALDDDDRLHNHVGGPHAGVLFSLGETASGAVVLAAFGAVLDRAVPLAVRAEIDYRRVATGPVSATARLRRSVAEVLAELAAGTRPEFTVEIQITTADGVVTTEMVTTWTLRPLR